jgi:hypothetical protein
VASALVNTMQQVGGSIGTAALSTVALTATASYLAAHHAGRLAPATAAVHGYSVAFWVSAALFGVGALIAVLLLPSRRRLEELRNTEPGTSAALEASPVLAASPASAASAALTDSVPAGDGVPR